MCIRPDPHIGKQRAEVVRPAPHAGPDPWERLVLATVAAAVRLASHPSVGALAGEELRSAVPELN